MKTREEIDITMLKMVDAWADHYVCVSQVKEGDEFAISMDLACDPCEVPKEVDGIKVVCKFNCQIPKA